MSVAPSVRDAAVRSADGSSSSSESSARDRAAARARRRSPRDAFERGGSGSKPAAAALNATAATNRCSGKCNETGMEHTSISTTSGSCGSTPSSDRAAADPAETRRHSCVPLRAASHSNNAAAPPQKAPRAARDASGDRSSPSNARATKSSVADATLSARLNASTHRRDSYSTCGSDRSRRDASSIPWSRDSNASHALNGATPGPSVLAPNDAPSISDATPSVWSAYSKSRNACANRRCCTTACSRNASASGSGPFGRGRGAPRCPSPGASSSAAHRRSAAARLAASSSSSSSGRSATGAV
mmetsp:Transcript_9280/g.28033  ORF Transcript_9280/g.28033 Transcript_9280/m.28033 type:complete len:301 (-) Transcript_9280:1471-2373(-)